MVSSPIYLSFQNSVCLNLSTLKLALIATSLAAQIHNNNDKRHLGPSLHKDFPWMQSACDCVGYYKCIPVTVSKHIGDAFRKKLSSGCLFLFAVLQFEIQVATLFYTKIVASYIKF